MSELLGELASGSDLVLIDSPPLLSVGDTAALFPKVDAVILVANTRSLRRQMLAETRRILQASQTVPLGVVVTHTKAVFVGTCCTPGGILAREERLRTEVSQPALGTELTGASSEGTTVDRGTPATTHEQIGTV